MLPALTEYVAWYTDRFGEIRPEWYVFPFGKPRPSDPTRPVTTLKTAWSNVRDNANVTGRWHDNRHTLITELAESGAGDQTIMDIAGHVSKQMATSALHLGDLPILDPGRQLPAIQLCGVSLYNPHQSPPIPYNSKGAKSA